MQMRGKWIQIWLKVKRVREQQGFLTGGWDSCSCLPLLGLRGVSSFTATATANRWGRTNHDLRRVETALETIVLCEGRRSWGGASADRGASQRTSRPQQLSQPLSVAHVTHAVSIQRDAYIALAQRNDRFMLSPFNPDCLCVCVCCMCVSLALAACVPCQLGNAEMEVE